MTPKDCIVIGAQIDSGRRGAGCLMGPDAIRTAGLATMINSLGHRLTDQGNLPPAALRPQPDQPKHLHQLAETIAWTEALIPAARDAAAKGFPIFLGGDHSISLGTVAGVAADAARRRRPLFVLWLDAHPDFHTPQSTESGNLHGTPLAYVTGQEGFDAFPPLPAKVPGENICLLGIRSVDGPEQAALVEHGVRVHDMRVIDEHGIVAPISAFLADVAAANGLLHVSLDVDFLDPAIAPAVGTTVPGGATFREAHLVMELLHDSGLVSSLDLVELNPFLDDRGRTASLMVDLTASLLGRKVFDRPTRSFS